MYTNGPVEPTCAHSASPPPGFSPWPLPCAPAPSRADHPASSSCRSHDHPSQEALQHTVAAASRTLSLLRSLVEPGSPSPSSEPRWLDAFCAPPDAFDALILLRPDSLPHACRALPHGVPVLGGGKGRAGKRGAGRQPDALTAAEEAAQERPAKRARVFLRAFPEKVSLGMHFSAEV